MKISIIGAMTSLLTAAGALGFAIAFGGPTEIPAMLSVNNPFQDIDYSDLPAIKHFPARDGSGLAYREYAGGQGLSKKVVVLIHGSAASGRSMHIMAKAFAKAGYTAYALDIRGHGDSGPKGQIAYIGQLEDDLADFVKSVDIASTATLVGFSSGGGFALRFAGGARQKLFANYLLLAPYIHQDAPTFKPAGGGWVSIGLPRIIALSALNKVGVTRFNDLPVLRFALNDEAKRFLTPEYSFALASNFRPNDDYRMNIRSSNQPMAILVGKEDEVFHADRFSDLFNVDGKTVPVTIIPRIGHIALTLNPIAVQAAVSAVDRLDSLE
ncbi:MAG: Lysophospholipase [Herbaspirillum sp.]|jgi:non-heme chloroperoxidase|nr:Lysophospholipase [Herbaspirillum sp.]